MGWSFLWVPLAVMALASLVGWAVVNWVSRKAALGLVALLVAASVGVTVLALVSDDMFAALYVVWAIAVFLPAAIGVVVGAMLALRAER